MMSSAVAEATDRVVLETRFGTFEFDVEQAIHMPQGILGFADMREYGLVQPDAEKFGQFAVLQSLADANLSFIVLPIPNNGGGLIDPADVEDASKALDIPQANLAVLLISTIRRNPDNSTAITVNLQAPLFIDTDRRKAWQYVLHNAKYSVRHSLTG